MGRTVTTGDYLPRRSSQVLAARPLSASTARGAVTLTCGGSRYRLETLPAEQFPPTLTASEAAEFALGDDDRCRLFEVPDFAISREET